MKRSLAYAASSPFVHPLMSAPLTFSRLSRLLSCVLSASEKEPDGGERKGGGNGRGERLAKSAMPVSKRNGGAASGEGADAEGEYATGTSDPRYREADAVADAVAAVAYAAHAALLLLLLLSHGLGVVRRPGWDTR
jgi:hypothetical protein